MTDKMIDQLDELSVIRDADILYAKRDGIDFKVSAGTLRQGLLLSEHAGAGGVAHAEATPEIAGFLSGHDKAKLDALADAAFSPAAAFAAVAHDHIWSHITDTPTTIAGYGINDVRDAAAWKFRRIAHATVIDLDAGDSRSVIYCESAEPVEIRIPEDLGSDFECVVMTAPDAAAPFLTAAPGQSLRSDGELSMRSGPSAALIRRVDDNTWIALGMRQDALSLTWGNIAQVPATIAALANLPSGESGTPLFAGQNSAEMMPIGSVGKTLAASDNVAAAQSALGLGSAATRSAESFAAAHHQHAVSEIGDLELRLEAKAGIDHAHDMSAVAGLLETLASTAPIVHGHSVPEIDGLAAMIDACAPKTHGHSMTDIAGLSTALTAFAGKEHAHPAATSDAAGFLSSSDKARIDALRSAAFHDVDTFAAKLHGHDWSAIAGRPSTVDGYGIIDVRHAARWPQTRLVNGGLRNLTPEDTRRVLYCKSTSDLEIRIPGDLGEDFECAVIVAPDAVPPLFTAAAGQTLVTDGQTRRARPGPSITVVRRIDQNEWIVLGLAGDNVVSQWSELSDIPPIIATLAEIEPVAGTIPYFDASKKAASAAFGAMGQALLAASDAAEARALLAVPATTESPPVAAPYSPGRYFSMGLPGDGGTLNTGLIGLTPFLVRHEATFDSIAIEVVTPQSSSSIRVGIYGANGSQLGALLAGSAALSSATVGLRSSPAQLTLNPGLYFLAYTSSHSGVAVRMQTTFAPALYDLGSDNGLNGPSCYGISSRAYGALPNTIGAVTWLPGVTCPRLMLRAA
jgi:hypothetical protein